MQGQALSFECGAPARSGRGAWEGDARTTALCQLVWTHLNVVSPGTAAVPPASGESGRFWIERQAP